jgi:hypothetical protein
MRSREDINFQKVAAANNIIQGDIAYQYKKNME